MNNFASWFVIMMMTSIILHVIFAAILPAIVLFSLAWWIQTIAVGAVSWIVADIVTGY